MIPADEGPKAFNVSNTVKPRLWVVLYKGRVSPPESGIYHFVGAGDDVMIARLNGQVVLDRCYDLRANLGRRLRNIIIRTSATSPAASPKGRVSH